MGYNSTIIFYSILTIYFLQTKYDHRLIIYMNLKITKMSENKFYWNEDTLDHFKLTSNYQTYEATVQEITAFVENECDLEEGETEEMLINDLVKQVYNK